MIRDILGCVVCGVEHSGTTIMLKLLRESSELDGGAECFGLKCDKPRDFIKSENERYSRIFRQCWKISLKDFPKVVDVNTFEEFYYNARKYSPEIKNKNVRLIDKTPAYIYDLERYIKKIEDVPVIIMKKDPRNMVHSLVKRGININRAIDIYNLNYDIRLKNYLKEHSEQIMVVCWENLIINLDKVFGLVCKFIGLKVNFKYDNVNIMPELIKQYRSLNDNEINLVEISISKEHFLEI